MFMEAVMNILWTCVWVKNCYSPWSCGALLSVLLLVRGNCSQTISQLLTDTQLSHAGRLVEAATAPAGRQARPLEPVPEGPCGAQGDMFPSDGLGSGGARRETGWHMCSSAIRINNKPGPKHWAGEAGRRGGAERSDWSALIWNEWRFRHPPSPHRPEPASPNLSVLQSFNVFHI